MGASVTWPFAALAQQAGRTYRLGSLLPLPRDAPLNVAFFDELRRRGFIEGQNLTNYFRSYAQHIDLIPQYAAELLSARVDVITVAGIGSHGAKHSGVPALPCSSAPKILQRFSRSSSKSSCVVLSIDHDLKRSRNDWPSSRLA